MNITLTITGDTPADIMTAIQELSKSSVMSNGTVILNEEKPPVKKIEKAAEEKKPAETIAQTPSITLESVRALVQEKQKQGKRDGLKALLTKFGVERVTSLAKEQYADFTTEVKAL
jgi:hypothetical protein